MKLSPHFTLEELCASETASRKGWNNMPGPTETANLKRLCVLLEEARKLIDAPIIINSGYRSKILNDAVGSKDTSQHRSGCAADFRVPGLTPKEVCRLLYSSDLQYDQLIQEFYEDGKPGGWTHISVPSVAGAKPRRSTLIIDSKGTRIFY